MFGYTVRRLAVSAASNGDNALLPADPMLSYKVVCGVLVGAGAVSAKFTDGAGGDDLTGAMLLAGSTVLPLPFNQEGHVQTSRNKALVLNLSAGTAVHGWLTVYVVQERGE